jgi:pyrroline-5-carboxylate reductase
MRIGVIGTGRVATAVGTGLAAASLEHSLGTHPRQANEEDR